MNLPPPTTSQAIPDEWIAAVKEAGFAPARSFRAHPTLPRIQGSVGQHWHDLMLFGSGYDFVSNEERDLVLGRIRG